MNAILRAATAAALVVLSSSPSVADRRISAAEVQRALAGKAFQLMCIDGTYGRGFFNTHGVVTVSYRRPLSSRDDAETAAVHSRGDEICLAWKNFDGGGISCYPVTMKAANLFRLGIESRW